MNAKAIIAASALALLGNAAFAYESPDLATPSTLSRAEVSAELTRAQKAGEIPTASETYFYVDSAIVAAQNPGLSRAAVKQQLANAGGITVTNEAYGKVDAGQGLNSRADVRAQAAAAVDANLYNGAE